MAYTLFKEFITNTQKNAVFAETEKLFYASRNWMNHFIPAHQSGKASLFFFFLCTTFSHCCFKQNWKLPHTTRFKVLLLRLHKKPKKMETNRGILKKNKRNKIKKRRSCCPLFSGQLYPLEVCVCRCLLPLTSGKAPAVRWWTVTT